jgi:hypothetical protein
MSFPFLQPYAGLSNSLQTAQAAVGGGAVGGWVELGRTTLGSTGNNIDVNSLPDKRYYMILHNSFAGSSGYLLDRYRLNGDTGLKYSVRNSTNGGADDTATSSSEGVGTGGGSVFESGEIFTVGYIANIATKEKLLQLFSVHNEANGATTAPDRQGGVGKHAQTTNPVTSVNCVDTNSNDFLSGSQVVVLGWDPADTHTSNFWEELASVNGDGTGGFDTGTFTSKKYLWVQAWLDNSTSSRNNFRVGNTTVDTGSNYANRGSTDGGADSTETSVTIVRGNATSYSTPTFFNMFIINNTSNEKLVIGHSVNQNTAGAATAPSRIEFTSKWANTSNQIDIIEAFPSSGNYNTGSIIKVWGAD